MRWSWVLLALVPPVLGAGCGGAPAPPPRPGETAALDPLVRRSIEEALGVVDARPEEPESRGRLARVYHANELAGLAETTYLQALELDGRPRWWYGLALVRAERGDFEGALDALDEARARGAGYAPLAWRRGSWLLELGRLDEARRALARAPDGDPAAETFLARLDLLQGRPQGALSRLEPLLERYPDLGYLSQLAAEAYRRLERFPEARRAMTRASGVPPRWPDPWEEEVLALRTGYRAVLERAESLGRRGRHDEAVALLEETGAEFPGDATLLVKAAEVLLDAGRASEARRTLEEALERDPEHLAAHVQLSRALRVQGRLDEALDHAERALEAHPAFAPAHRQRVDVLLARRDWAGAEAALRDFLRHDRPSADLYADLGNVQIQAGRWDAADASLRSALEIDPEHFQSLLLSAHLHGLRGDREGAESVLETAARLRPGDPGVARTARFLESLGSSGEGEDR